MRRIQVCQNATAARSATITDPAASAVMSQPVERRERIPSASAIATRMNGERVGHGVSLGTGMGSLLTGTRLDSDLDVLQPGVLQAPVHLDPDVTFERRRPDGLARNGGRAYKSGA
jgi:hypothetical protein